MKKTTILFLLSIALPFLVIAQENEIDNEKKSEIKIDAFNLIAFEYIDVSYEYLINEEASFGIAVQFSLDEVEANNGYGRNFALTPYFRQYFSNKYAAGFFVEGFAMLNTGNEDYYYLIDDSITNNDYTNFALGISIGGKFITKKGFVAEIYSGIGRNIIGSDFAPEIVGRVGISLGFRY